VCALYDVYVCPFSLHAQIELSLCKKDPTNWDKLEK
jgi:hypothetical protein